MALGLALLNGPSTQAAEGVGPVPLSEYDIPGLQQTISIDLKGMEIVEGLEYFAIQYELNIVASNQISGAVHLYLENVTVAQALQALLSMNRLAYVVDNDIIRVMTENEYRTLFGQAFYDLRVTRTFKLQYASARNVSALLQNLKSERGEIVFDENTGTLIVTDIPEKMDRMAQVVNEADLPTITRQAPTETKTYMLQYADVEELQTEINGVLTPDVGTARFNKRTNSLIVSDLPHKVAIIDEIVSTFDRKTREVFIEARIVQVTLSDAFQLGIDWASLQDEWKLPVEIIAKDVDLRHANLSLLTTGALTQTFMLKALKTFGETRLLSDPRLTVQDGHEATLEVVTSEAYEAGTSEVDSGGVTTSYRNFEFIDVGVSLSVIPKINDEGFVNMLIKPEVSSVISWYGGASGPAEERSAGAVPIVKRSTAETTVTVKDGVTIVIGGLIDESTVSTEQKVPILGNIPLLKYLFRRTSDSTERRETIIFLTPHIVTGDRSMPWDTYEEKQIKGLRE